MARTITANYPGRCPDCSRPFRAGDPITHIDGKGWGHAQCPPRKGQPQAKPQAQAPALMDPEPEAPAQAPAMTQPPTEAEVALALATAGPPGPPVSPGNSLAKALGIPDPWANFAPSPYQAGFRLAVEGTPHHLVVAAVAGSGKTTTAKWIVETTPALRGLRVLVTAFNNSITSELRKKLPAWVHVMGLNSAGGRLVAAACRAIDPNIGWSPLYRMMWVCDDTDAGRYNRSLEAPVLKLCALARGALVEPAQSNLARLADRHDVEGFYEAPSEVSSRVACLMAERVVRFRDFVSRSKASEKAAGDFDDQIWLPYALDLKPTTTYDVVIVDEAQDLNAAQANLILRLTGNKGRIIAIGDPRQAIYGFRGAGITSMEDLTSTLNGTNRGVNTLPLSVCYRCPSKVIRLVQETGYCPGIEAAPGAPEGSVEVMAEGKLIDIIRPDPTKVMVLSSLNAPLIPAVLACIREGIPAAIQGREADKEVRKIISRARKYSNNTIDSFVSVLTKHRADAVKRAIARNEAPESVVDVYDTVQALCDVDGVETIDDLEGWVSKVFVQDAQAAVLMSTVHRAKGMERNTVCILRPDAMPVFWCKQEWEHRQARNLAYVAFTRAQERLVFMTGPKAPVHPEVAAAIRRVNGPPKSPPGPDGAPQNKGANVAPTEDPGLPGDASSARAGDDSYPLPRGEPGSSASNNGDAPADGPADADMPAFDPTKLPSYPTTGDGAFTPPTMEDWEVIRAAYEAAGCKADILRPVGWRMYALVVASPKTMVRVSTTLDSRGGQNRAKGANAVDICLVNDPEGKPTGGMTKVLRTAGWQGRVCERINKLLR